MGLDRTTPAAELEATKKELAAAHSQETRRKRRWDVSHPTEKEEKPSGEWSQETLQSLASMKRRSRWDATPANVAEGPKRSFGTRRQLSPVRMRPWFLSS